jgi:hypothetical protein
MQNNILAGGPIYATEAARNTAIPSPFEGQRAYITGSTVTAPTGLATYVPPGIQTIYNGSAWVCVTPIGAFTTTAGTTTSTTSTATLTGGGTNPTVTIATGTTALVHLSAYVSNSASSTNYVEVIATGAPTNSGYGAIIQVSTGSVNFAQTISASFIVAGLTPGDNLFTMQYYTNTGTLSVSNRRITVQGIS